MILEGLVTTQTPHGELNIAPMGPVVDPDLTSIVLRPFQTSRTFQNLREHPYGVLHITDDVLLMARGALNLLEKAPETFPARVIAGRVIAGCCRWLEFEIESIDASRDRSEIRLKVVHRETIRDFWGFNRAKHAVLEATILATRLHLIPPEEIRRALLQLREPVEKTAGPEELTAFQLVWDYVHRHLDAPR
ncbi:MAG: DUF447 family protein [Planctomycetaceae bacterium]|nr:DUF447 family protein [Planctomycetaceae bacterium]